METWKPVVGAEEFYKISDQGRVKSLHRWGRPAKNGFLSQTRNKKGYCRVHLSHRGKSYGVLVHRLVLEAFVSPPPSALHQANHKNGKKHENHLEILEWVTPVQNNAHAVAHGWWHPHIGEAHGRAIFREKQVLEIRALQGKVTQADLGRQFGVTAENIYRILTRRTWKHLPA